MKSKVQKNQDKIRFHEIIQTKRIGKELNTLEWLPQIIVFLWTWTDFPIFINFQSKVITEIPHYISKSNTRDPKLS